MAMLQSRPLPANSGGARERSILVITNEPPDVLAPLLRAIESNGVEARTAPPRPWLLDDAPAVLLRIDEAAPPIDAVDELLPLEARGDAVLNRPAALKIAQHTLLASSALVSGGVAHPRAFGCFDSDDAVERAFALGFPVVLRTAYSRGGDGVRVCVDPDAVWEHCAELAGCGDFAGISVQECIPAPADVHVLVAGSDAAGASLHLPSAGTSAAAWEPVAIGEVIADLAVRAVRAVGGDLMSAHVLVGADDRVVVVDVNPNPPIHRFANDAWANAGAYVASRCEALD